MPARALPRDPGLTGAGQGHLLSAGNPRARQKFFAGVKDAETRAVHRLWEEKELLMETALGIWLETDHSMGRPAILIRLGAIGDEDLCRRSDTARRTRAGKRLISARDASR